jgi:ribosome recycling factor
MQETITIQAWDKKKCLAKLKKAILAAKYWINACK